MADSPLRRIYCFSDTFGRHKSYFIQDDADAVISTHFRSFPLRQRTREFDIYGRENVTAHLLRVIFGLHEHVRNATYFPQSLKDEFEKTTTGIFINAAPRTKTNENGALFYIATSKNIRIVTTDLAGLSSIKDRIETLSHLPNTTDKYVNNLYGPTEQFRSSYTPFLLDVNHGLTVVEDSLDLIPDYPKDHWELAYVDRFGNMITHCQNPEKKWEEISTIAKQNDGKVTIIVGNVSQDVYVGKSLKDAEPGSLVIYPNGDLEILRKWTEGEDNRDRLFHGAFFRFDKPDIGDRIRIAGQPQD